MFKQFKKYLKKTLKSEAKDHQIKYYIKKCMKYSYKRGGSRALKAKEPNSVYLQGIYSAKVLGLLQKEKLLANVDESSFNKSVKHQYSWLPKGLSHPIVNGCCKGSTSVIFGLLSNGHWVAMIKGGTNNSKIFTYFLCILSKFAQQFKIEKEKPLTMILDNASLHLTKLSMDTAMFLKIQMISLPPYCPNLAPVETIFGIIKRKICTRNLSDFIDFGKPGGRKLLSEAFKEIRPCTVKKIWLSFIREAFRVLVEAKKKGETFEILQQEAEINDLGASK